MSEISSKLAKGAVWIAAGRIVFVSIGFLNTIILARLLLPSDFGLVAIATTINTIIQSLTNMALSAALVQHDAPTREHYNTAFTLNVLRSTVLGILIAVGGVLFSSLYQEPRLVGLFLAIGASTIVMSFSNPKLVVMLRNLVFWQEFLIQSSNKLLTFIVAVTVAVIWKSYWALIVGIFAGQFLSLILGYVIVPYMPGFAVTKWRELISFSGWITLKDIVENLNWRSDNLFVAYLLGNSALGFYNVGQNLATMPTREAISPIARTLFPAFSRIKNEKERLRRNYQKAQELIASIAIPAGIGFALVADDLVRLALGEKWLGVIPVIQFIAGLAAIQTLGETLNPLAMAMGRTRLLFTRGLIDFAIRLPLTITGIFMDGIIGLLLARLVSGSAALVIRMFLVRRLIGLTLAQQIWRNWPTFLSTGIMCLVCVSVQRGISLWRSENLVLETAAVILLSGLTYITSRLVIWHFRGKVEGPETLVMEYVSKLRGRFVPKSWEAICRGRNE